MVGFLDYDVMSGDDEYGDISSEHLFSNERSKNNPCQSRSQAETLPWSFSEQNSKNSKLAHRYHLTACPLASRRGGGGGVTAKRWRDNPRAQIPGQS